MKFFSHDAPEFRDVPTQKLREVQRTEEIRDAAFEHKPIGFFKDAAIRFCKSRISMAALVGILIVLLFAIFGPGTPVAYSAVELMKILLGEQA